MKQYSLKNGITTIFYPIDTAYSVALSLNVNAGSLRETPENNGITHLLEHLHFRRLKNLSQEELYYRMDVIGGELNAATHRARLRFHTRVRPRFISDAMELFDEILMTDRWTEEDMEAEKRVVLCEIAEDDDGFDMEELVIRSLYEGTPLAMPIAGTDETVRGITAEDAAKYKQEIFSKGNVYFVAVGKLSDGDIETINRSLEKHLLPDQAPAVSCPPPRFNARTVFFKRGFDYPSVTLSFAVSDDTDRFALMLLNAILGGGTGSVLLKEIRERLGLTYNISSCIRQFGDYSLLNINFSTEEDSILPCVKEIFAVMERLCSGVSERDYRANITYFTDNIWYDLEDTQSLNDTISWDFIEDGLMTLEKKLERYQRVTVRELTETAQAILLPENCSIFAAGKIKAKTKKALQALLQE